MAALPRVLRFGVFEIHVHTGELRRRGYLIPLPPQPFAVREAHKVLALAHAPKDYMARFESLPPRAAMQFYVRGSIVHLEGLRSALWVTSDEFARLRAMEGEADRALSDLERAADERSPRLLPYLNDPAFDALRTSERFRALQRRVRVPRSESATRGRLLAVAVVP